VDDEGDESASTVPQLALRERETTHFFSLRANMIWHGTMPFSRPRNVKSGAIDIWVVCSYKWHCTGCESIWLVATLGW